MLTHSLYFPPRLRALIYYALDQIINLTQSMWIQGQNANLPCEGKTNVSRNSDVMWESGLNNAINSHKGETMS